MYYCRQQPCIGGMRGRVPANGKSIDYSSTLLLLLLQCYFIFLVEDHDTFHCFFKVHLDGQTLMKKGNSQFKQVPLNVTSTCYKNLQVHIVHVTQLLYQGLFGQVLHEYNFIVLLEKPKTTLIHKLPNKSKTW